MPKRRPVEEDDDIEGLLDDAPDDLEDDDDLLSYFSDRLGIEEDEIEGLVEEAEAAAGVLAALALLKIFSAGWDALDGAQVSSDEAREAALDEQGLSDRLSDIAVSMNENLSDQLDDGWGDDEGSAITGLAEISAQSEFSDGKSDADGEAGWDYLRYVATEDSCDECQDCDDTVLPADDPFWDDHTPPDLHPNCRCATVPLSEEEARKYGVDSEPPDVEGGTWRDKPPSDIEDYPPELADIFNSKA